jgi:mRNA interferase RelE/StbE
VHKLVLSEEAQKVYRSADSPLARKLAKCFLRIESNPRVGNNIRALKGPLAGAFRYRAGDWRVVYSIDDAARTVSVITIAHRRDVYD